MLKAKNYRRRPLADITPKTHPHEYDAAEPLTWEEAGAVAGAWHAPTPKHRHGGANDRGPSLDPRSHTVTREELLRLLVLLGWSTAAVAQALGITQRAVQIRMGVFGLSAPTPRASVATDATRAFVEDAGGVGPALERIDGASLPCLATLHADLIGPTPLTELLADGPDTDPLRYARRGAR